MEGLLITILIITGFLIYKVISSSRKQEGYKRWKSGNSIRPQASAGNATSRKSWFAHLFESASATFSARKEKTKVSFRFNTEAVDWCVGLLGVDRGVLIDILKDPAAQYREFWMGKRKGGYRMISAPGKELKAIQDTIYHRILLPVALHPAATGFRHQLSISDNVRPHLGKPYVLKTDIHDFFGSIRSARVRKTFEKMGYPKHISKVLAALCCARWKLPQGASTSPALSNIIAYEMDKKLSALAAEHGLTYTRYADDLTFSGNAFTKEQVLPQIQRIIEEEQFALNHKKTRIIAGYQRKIITGVSISSGVKLTIPKVKKREIRKNVHFILTKGLAEHQRRIRSTDPVYLKRLIGTLCYWRSIEPDNPYVSGAIEALKRVRH